MKHLALLPFVLLVFASSIRADIRLPKIVSSNMVLQRNADATIWGWANPGETITIQTDWLATPTKLTANAEGEWQTKLATTNDRLAHKITIRGKQKHILKNVRFGEVWLASGQSNMEMPLIKVSGAYTGIRNAAKEVRHANEANIVLFQVGNFSSKNPLDDVEAGNQIYGVPPAKCEWLSCSSDTIPTFSSTAYFFARELERELDVPIGIIDASWGGTSAEAWTPKSGLERLGYHEDLQAAASRPQDQDQKTPTRLYNGMIHPLRRMTIRGSIWYQGEGNASRANKYEALFTTMIDEWRKAWGHEFPFYYTQIAPYKYNKINSAFLREAQFKSNSFPMTGMAVTMDIGNLTDIHPKNKQEVGRRLALWALAKDYKKDIVYSGPAYRSMAVEGSTIRVAFEYAAGGLATSDNQLPTHFEVAGPNEKFYAAVANIDGSDIVVSSSAVESPVAVRFAFNNEAMPNLVNQSGLPASSFRTDNW